MKDHDKYRGCLIGGAVGDALGYVVEFLSEKEIIHKYGKQGIASYETVKGVAKISDDTQMTLFTANGLLLAMTCDMTNGIGGNPVNEIAECYKDWFMTQTKSYPLSEYRYSWLVNVPELFSRRAPGLTCLVVLRNAVMNGEDCGTIETPSNNSKGCGGVMRVAPIGLYLGDHISMEKVDRIGAEVAALTHGHELGYIPAATMVHIINMVSHSTDVTLELAVKDSMTAMKKLFPQAKHLDTFLELMQRAIDLSGADMEDVEAIHQLGKGWVAEETLAIAIYCALKYQNDFEKAIIAAVNHGGDSDSTGAVAGNILGAYLGMSAIPEKYIDKLELKDVILELSDDLFHACQFAEPYVCIEVWERKYIYGD